MNTITCEAFEGIDRPPSMDFTQIEPKELPLSQWDEAVQEKHQQVLAERNEARPTQSGKQTSKDPNKNDVQIVDRSYLQKNFKNSLKMLLRNLNLPWIKKKHSGL